MRWPKPGDQYFDVVLARNYGPRDIVQVYATLEDRGGTQYAVTVEEEVTRPEVFTLSYSFSTRNSLVKPMKENDFRAYTYLNIARILETAKREKAEFDPFRVVTDRGDVVYDNIAEVQATPLTTEEINFGPGPQFTANPLEPTVFILRQA